MLEKCNSCKKEYFSTELYSIAEKYHDGNQVVGRFIYSCEKCYANDLDKFKTSMKQNSDFILRSPIK
jgi:hypothetical protein